MPVGPTAKVRSRKAAERLERSFRAVAANLGLQLEVLMTDGRQPVGRGIGPALEARDILAVLQNKPDAPQDLRERAILIAGAMLEMVAAVEPGQGQTRARTTLDSGAAWDKFSAICSAQGGCESPRWRPTATPWWRPTPARYWMWTTVSWRESPSWRARPADPAAGVELHVKIGDRLEKYQPLLTIHAENAGELNYAVDYLTDHELVVKLSQPEEESR